MWLCLFSARPFEETFEITQWRKIKQMQPVWLCLLWPKFFDETHKQAQSRRKVTIWHREQTLWCIKIDEININILHNDRGKLFCFLQRGAKKLGSKLMMTIIRGGVKNPILAVNGNILLRGWGTPFSINLAKNHPLLGFLTPLRNKSEAIRSLRSCRKSVQERHRKSDASQDEKIFFCFYHLNKEIHSFPTMYNTWGCS